MLEPVLHIRTAVVLEWAYSLGKELSASAYPARLGSVCGHEMNGSINVLVGRIGWIVLISVFGGHFFEKQEIGISS